MTTPLDFSALSQNMPDMFSGIGQSAPVSGGSPVSSGSQSSNGGYLGESFAQFLGPSFVKSLKQTLQPILPAGSPASPGLEVPGPSGYKYVPLGSPTSNSQGSTGFTQWLGQTSAMGMSNETLLIVGVAVAAVLVVVMGKRGRR